MKRRIGIAIVVTFVYLVTSAAIVESKDHGLPVFSVSISTPQKFTLSGGYAYMFDPRDNSDWVKGVVVRVEPGIAGTKGHVGPYFIGKNKWDKLFWSATVSVLRTYGNPWGVEGAQTYLGGELAASLFPILRINGGIYRNVSPDEGKDWVLSIGLGAGF